MDKIICSSCQHVRQEGEFGPINQCTQCGKPTKPVSGAAVPLQHAKQTTPARSPTTHGNINQRLAFIAAGVFVFGIFSPIIRLPMGLEISVFTGSKPDALLLMIIALGSILFAVKRRYAFHLYTGWLLLAYIAFSMVSIWIKINDIKHMLSEDLQNTSAKNAGEILMHYVGLEWNVIDAAMISVDLHWGWAMLVVGAGLMIAAAVYRED